MRRFQLLLWVFLWLSANRCYGLSPGDYDSASTPTEFAQIANRIGHANQTILVHGKDFGHPAQHAYGLLAWYDACAKSNDQAAQTLFRSMKEQQTNGTVSWTSLGEAGASTANDQTLVADVYYLIAALRDEDKRKEDKRSDIAIMDGVFDQLCRRLDGLGYKRVLIVEECVKDGHPGYRVFRDSKE